MYEKSREEVGKLFTIAEQQKGMPDCIGDVCTGPWFIGNAWL